MYVLHAIKSILASYLEYIFEPANLCVISSNVGAFWCLVIIVLLRSFRP